MLNVRNAADERGEYHRPSQDYENPMFIEIAAHKATMGLYLAAAISAAVSVLIWTRRYSGKVVYAVAFLLLFEMFHFALPLRTTFSLGNVRPVKIEEFLAKQQGDFRIFTPLFFANLGMSTGAFNISGYDAMILRRYAELTFYAAGQNPDDPDTHAADLPFTGSPLISGFYRMLRCRFIFYPVKNGLQAVEVYRPLERLNLLTDYRVIKSRDAIFKAMADPSYDPAKTVILESEPACKPAGNVPAGSMRIIDESTDHLTIEGQIDSPAILLVTDSYHRDWSARPLPGSSLSKYEVLPADYALRAVPLTAGTHRFRMEYRPPLFHIGVWTSVFSLLAYLAAWIWLGINKY